MLLIDYVLQLETKEIAQSSHVKDGATQLRLDDISATFTKLTVEMVLHMGPKLTITCVRGVTLASGIDADAPAIGNGLCDGAVNSGRSLLEFRSNVQDASVANQALGYGLLKLFTVQVRQTDHLPRYLATRPL
jgi:hypothetical protein